MLYYGIYSHKFGYILDYSCFKLEYFTLLYITMYAVGLHIIILVSVYFHLFCTVCILESSSQVLLLILLSFSCCLVSFDSISVCAFCLDFLVIVWMGCHGYTCRLSSYAAIAYSLKFILLWVRHHVTFVLQYPYNVYDNGLNCSTLTKENEP